MDGGRYGQRILASGGFGLIKKVRYRVVTLNGEERGKSMVWFAEFMGVSTIEG